MPKAKATNVRNATVIGTGVGAIATPIIVYAATLLEVKTSVPAAVTMPLLGAIAGLFMRWAAKLNPHD